MNNKPTEAEEAEFLAALSALNDDPQQVHVQFSKRQVWALLCTVQLASRHPLAGDSLTMRSAVDVVKQLQATVAPDGPLKRLAELGWQTEMDSPPIPAVPARPVNVTRH